MKTLPILALLFVASAVAQIPPASSFQALQWRLIGPFRGGRSVAAIGIPGDPGLFYFGSVGGGIWKSTDAGTVWNPLFDRETVASVGALEAAPSNPRILYAGTGEADIRSDIAFGKGVYRSDDAGAHWRNIGLRNTFHIGRIVIDPRNPDIVYVAALGHAYAPNAERGVFRTRDGGRTWEHVLDKGPEIGAVDLAMTPEDPNVLYAAMWQARRTPWSQYGPNEGPGSGLYRTTDAGVTWNAVSGSGLPQAQWGRSGIAIARGTQGRRVYLLVEAGKESGLYRSDDAAASWKRVSADPRITSRAWYFSFIAVDPNNPDAVYIPNIALLRSVDAGVTFTVLRGAPGGDDYHSIWIDPGNSARMIIGTDQGVSISLNGGRTWSTWYNQPTGQLYHVSADRQFPYNVCGSQQDSGSVCLPSRSNRGSITERDFTAVGGNEAGWTAPDPKDPNIVFGTDTYGTVTRFNRRTSQAQLVTPWPLPAFGINISQRKYRSPWTTALVFSPADPNALYLGTQFLLKTVDGGLHWQTISPDLTRTETKDCKDAPATLENAKPCGYGVLYTIAPSPLQADEIWVGSDTGLIHLTRDGGKTWTKVNELPAWSKITHIEASHFHAGEAWAAVDRHRLDDYAPYVYRTRDFGKTWVPVTDGLPQGAFLNAIREDPRREGLLFAATETGVFVSFDDAAHWQPLQLNLPPASVRDLVVHGDDLIAATHGRSFWILDDIAPLRQIDPAIARADVLLFPPATAMRVFTEPFHGTPLPPEVPAGKNPPDGALIDFWLAQAPSTPVELAIYDSRGTLVRSYTSGAKAPAIPHNLPVADIWLAPPPGLTANAGHNRFLWDLRYTGPKSAAADEDSESGESTGPLAIPGDYSVKLTVNGKTLTQSLHVDQDPRSPVSRTTLEQQRDLALRVVAAMDRATALEAALPAEARPALAQARTGFSSALAAILSADRTPSAQAVQVFEEALAAMQKLAP
jgi:photosystem II stability/assembly factor-like uncharacterized protein